MYILFTVLIVIAAILLTLLVLVQNSKGGGLAAGFASGNQVMGAPKTTDFLEKASWTLIGLIAIFSVCAVWAHKSGNNVAADQSQISEQVKEASESMQQSAPAADYNAEAAEAGE